MFEMNFGLFFEHREFFLQLYRGWVRSRRDLLLENLALRQQLAPLAPRQPFVIVKPETSHPLAPQTSCSGSTARGQTTPRTFQTPRRTLLMAQKWNPLRRLDHRDQGRDHLHFAAITSVMALALAQPGSRPSENDCASPQIGHGDRGSI